MKKLKLQPDDLLVDSFDTVGNAQATRGTVRAAGTEQCACSWGQYRESCVPPDPTEGWACPATEPYVECYPTLEGSCPETCPMTCDATCGEPTIYDTACNECFQMG